MRGEVALSEVTLTARPRVRLGPVGLLFAGIGRVAAWLFVIS
jgi:hypothetical protein